MNTYRKANIIKTKYGIKQLNIILREQKIEDVKFFNYW